MASLASLPHCQMLRCFIASNSCSSSGSSSSLFTSESALRRGRSREYAGASCRTRGYGNAPRLGTLNATSEPFSSPKTGSVGTERFKDGAAPGTYWSDSLNFGDEVSVSFNDGSKDVNVKCRAGDNLLKVAEKCGVMIPTRDFCFEGSCCHCEMEVEGGAVEAGSRADPRVSELIRSCICPVPNDRQSVFVNIWNDDDGWK